MLGQGRKKERERKIARTRTKIASKTLSFFLSSSRPTHLLHNQKSKTTPKKDQGKEKGRSKQGRGGGRKKEKLASKSTSKNFIKTQV